MKRLLALCAFSAMALMVLWPSQAATNLNSSRSNIYRLIYDHNVVSQTQGDALVKELQNLGAVDEAKLKTWLANNFKRHGIDGSRVKEIDVFLEQQISCESSSACKGKYVAPPPAGAVTIKSSKSNTSERVVSQCYCYDSISAQAQVLKVNKQSPIVIFLLSNPAQGNDAFAMAVKLNSSKNN